MHKIALQDQGYVYQDEQWHYPKVTPSPKARFFAENPGAELGTNGIVSFTNGTRKAFTPQDAGDGYKGFKITFPGNSDPRGDTMRELRYSLSRPTAHTVEFMQFKVPANFRHRAIDTLTLDVDKGTLDWAIDQQVSSYDGDTLIDTGVIRAISGGKKIKDKTGLWIDKAKKPYHIAFRPGYTLKNHTTGEAFKILDRGFEGMNNKLSAQWVGKYSNGGMILEYAKDKTKPYSYTKAQIATTETYPNNGNEKNQLDGQPSLPPLIHDDDKGKWVNLVIERIRSTDKTSRDGGWRIWKSVNDLDYERLELMFESLGHHSFTTAEDNLFTAGYLFGWSNSGFDEDTSYFLRDYQLWLERPSFLRIPHA